MRSSVPCSSWIDSLSLVDIQVVSLKRDYYVSLACQVDLARNNPSRKNAHGTPTLLTGALIPGHWAKRFTLIDKNQNHASGCRACQKLAFLLVESPTESLKLVSETEPAHAHGLSVPTAVGPTLVQANFHWETSIRAQR